MMVALVALAAFTGGIVYCSFFEWTLHKYLMHKPLLGFRYAFKAHAQTHHRIFEFEETYSLQRDEDKTLVAMAWWNAPVIIAANTPVWFGAGMIAGLGHFTANFWIGAVGAACSMVVYYAVYESLHWCMHVPGHRWFSNARWFKFLDDHHRMHHKRPMSNLNVVFPLADLILRTKAPGLPPVSRMATEAREAARVS
jgi:hypothetical protein